MSFPPKITQLPALWSISREEQAIQCIIAHDTERPSNDSNSIEYLRNGGGREVSIHALIETNGDIYIMVADALGANHAGYGTLTINGVTYSPKHQYSINHISLGFELEYTKAPYNQPYPEVQLLSMGYWLHMKQQQYGKLPIYRHEDVDPSRKHDTRNLSIAEIEHWIDKAAMLLNEVPTPDNPLMYRFIVPQVVYTERKLGSRFAGTALNPAVMQNNTRMPIGDITDGWAWIATGIGFVPLETIIRDKTHG
jgi:hypothetical protein